MDHVIQDRNRNRIEVGMKLRVCHCTGSYGQTTTDEGVVQELDRYFGVYLELIKPTRWKTRDGVKPLNIGDRYYIPLPGQFDFSKSVFVCEKTHHDVEHGHHAWAEII